MSKGTPFKKCFAPLFKSGITATKCEWQDYWGYSSRCANRPESPSPALSSCCALTHLDAWYNLHSPSPQSPPTLSSRDLKCGISCRHAGKGTNARSRRDSERHWLGLW